MTAVVVSLPVMRRCRSFIVLLFFLHQVLLRTFDRLNHRPPYWRERLARRRYIYLSC